eukprot:jgi/Mesen1/3966/ME000210S03211
MLGPGSMLHTALQHPYMIDVRTNPTGEEYLAYNKRRWGSDSWTHSLRRSAARNGLQFGDWKWWPNTLHAHRLVRLASSRGQGTEAKDLLLRKTYEEGQNISDPKVLCAAADELGIEGARTYLESGEGTDEIVEEDSDAKRARGISGVPYFLIDNRYVLKGAQEVEALKDALERALLRRQQEDQGTGASP